MRAGGESMTSDLLVFRLQKNNMKGFPFILDNVMRKSGKFLS